MLIILYCKPKKNQGKKLFVRQLVTKFGVIPIKKFTSKQKSDDGTYPDDNLQYLHSCFKPQFFHTHEAFISAVKSSELYRINNNESPLLSVADNTTEDIQKLVIDDFYTYAKPSTKQPGVFLWYAIYKPTIQLAIRSKDNYVVVCTSIETIKAIYADTDQTWRIKAYCLIRQKNDDDDQIETSNVNVQQLVERIKSGILTLPSSLKVLSDSTIVLTSDNKEDIDFFKNIVYFRNLLIIPEVPNIVTNMQQYEKNVSAIIEKYMELEKCPKNVFVVHPMSAKKFITLKQIDAVTTKKGKQALICTKQSTSAIERETILFKNMIRAVFCPDVLLKKVVLHFADDIQKQVRTRGPFEYTQEILKIISTSQCVIGDLRNFNHNCLFEIGYAKGKLPERDCDDSAPSVTSIGIDKKIQPVRFIRNENEADEEATLLSDLITTIVPSYNLLKLTTIDECRQLITRLRHDLGVTTDCEHDSALFDALVQIRSQPFSGKKVKCVPKEINFNYKWCGSNCTSVTLEIKDLTE